MRTVFILLLFCCIVFAAEECTDEQYDAYLTKTVLCPGYDDACSFRHLVDYVELGDAAPQFKDINFYLRHDNNKDKITLFFFPPSMHTALVLLLFCCVFVKGCTDDEYAAYKHKTLLCTWEDFACIARHWNELVTATAGHPQFSSSCRFLFERNQCATRRFVPIADGYRLFSDPEWYEECCEGRFFQPINYSLFHHRPSLAPPHVAPLLSLHFFTVALALLFRNKK